MSRKSTALLVLLTSVPLLVFAWLGARIARSEKARVEEQFRAILRERLTDINSSVESHFENLLRQLQAITDESFTIDRMRRELVRHHPLLNAVIVLDSSGKVVLPNLNEVVADWEFEFLTQIGPILEDRDLVRQSRDLSNRFQLDNEKTSEMRKQNLTSTRPTLPVPPFQQRSQPTSLRQQTSTHQRSTRPQSSEQSSRILQPVSSSVAQETEAAPKEQGWYVWFFGRGVNLIYWKELDDGRIGVASLPRSRWVADLISDLPETKKTALGRTSDDADSRICLVDSNNQVVYQWGNLEVDDSQEPLAELPAVHPLSSWRIKYFRSDSPIVSNALLNSLPVIGGIVLVGCGLMAISFVFYREYSRDMREAARRVNFVNQVSHELKTPLTNIRMYADLLEMDLSQLPDEQNKPLQNRLGVIVSESQRLSRLIGNVLTFGRSQRQQVTIRRSKNIVDDIVQSVVKRFRPSLERSGFEIETDLNACHLVQVDSDALEQILGNLISNVERYAADGKFLGIRSEQNQTNTTIRVIDKGRGISMELNEKVFTPFFRISNEISDATGTGIGLSIAQSLARLHGGDIKLESSSDGCQFRVELNTASLDPNAK